MREIPAVRNEIDQGLGEKVRKTSFYRTDPFSLFWNVNSRKNSKVTTRNDFFKGGKMLGRAMPLREPNGERVFRRLRR